MTSHDQGNGIPSRILALTGGVWMPSSQFLISRSISWKNGMLCHFEPMQFAWHHGIYIYIHSEIEANIWRSIINHPYIYIYLNDTWKCCRIDTCFKSWSSLSRSASSSGWKHWPIVWSTPSCKLAQLHRFEHEVAMPMKTNTPTLPKWSKWLNQISSLDMMIKRWNQQSMVLFVHAECSK